MNSKYKNLFLALLSGILFGISFPTNGFPIFVFFAFVPLLLIEQSFVIYQTKYSYFKLLFLSFIAFFVWNIFSIHWLYFAKRPDGTNSLEAMILPVIINAFLMSLVFLIYHFIKKNAGSYFGLVFFPCIWIAFENFHLNWELTFPWLNLGNIFANYHKWVQWYEFTGSFGGSLWIILVNLFIFYQFRAYQASRKKEYLKKLFVFSSIFILIPIFISLIRYYTYQEQGEEVEIVIVQPELDPYNEKYSLDNSTIVNTILDLAKQKITPNTKFVVAPETAFPGIGSIDEDNIKNDAYINGISKWIKTTKNHNLAFVSGVKTIKYHQNIPELSETIFYNPYSGKNEEHFNSGIEITAKDTVEIYHKSKLVVGVEKLPYMSIFKEYFSSLSDIFGGTMHSLGIQTEREVFTNNNIKIAPIICYESIYGEFTTDYVKKGADFLFIMTNDSWWDNSQGHKQLLAFAKLRAIENRRSIARSANSGISCFINQKGDVINPLPYLSQGSINGKILTNKTLSFYSKNGDYIVSILHLILGICLAFTLFFMFSKRSQSKKIF